MQLQDWKNKGQYFDYKGHTIFFVQDGQGVPLVLIHGYPTSSWDWYKLWPQCTARFQTIAPDMIGFGYSAKPKKYTYSIHDQADLYEALLAKQGIAKAHILAHDYGDTVAQELLARYEDRRKKGQTGGLEILSICFLNGGIFPETHFAKPVQKLLISPIGFLVVKLMGARKFRATFKEIFGPQTQPSEQEFIDFWHLINLEDGKNVLHKLIFYMEDRRRHRERWVNCLIETQVPLRVIDGAYDPVSGAHMVARYHELIPNPDTVLLPNIGHYPQVEAPEQVWQHFMAFQEGRVQQNNPNTAFTA
ncbi:MAG TPA: alpha/beta hydrolase [Microscillaceae bacterium]|jgi:pimeloyl-ACP methyl ester carboxylesterase|nr:alpha/beta hydrolase [Microscillaceae bacterium]